VEETKESGPHGRQHNTRARAAMAEEEANGDHHDDDDEDEDEEDEPVSKRLRGAHDTPTTRSRSEGAQVLVPGQAVWFQPDVSHDHDHDHHDDDDDDDG
jgi:hypothetical protein